MMTIVNVLDRLAEWTQKNICNPVTFKIPPEEDERDGKGYNYKQITPSAFIWQVPSKEKLPPGIISPIPSVCIRIQDGEDARNHGVLNLDLCFSVWNPGTHGNDYIYPMKNEAGEQVNKQWDGVETKEYFARNTGGWRDVWNWIDLALRELRNAMSIDGIQVDHDSIKFGPFKQEAEIPDFYPFWFAYINFTVRRPIVRTVKEFEGML